MKLPVPFYREYYHVTYYPRSVYSFVVYCFFLLALIGAVASVCWFTQKFWLLSDTNCGEASISFVNDSCLLHVVTMMGVEQFWSCSEEFNRAVLIPENKFVQPFFMIRSEAEVDFFISVPIGEFGNSIYDNPPREVTPNEAFDAIQSISFIPRFSFTIKGNGLKTSAVVAPELTYTRNVPYLSNSRDSTTNSYSGGPIGVHQDFLLTYASPANFKENVDLFECDLKKEALNPLASSLSSFTSVCSSEGKTVKTTLSRERVGGLGSLGFPGGAYGITNDLDQLNAFNWRVRISLPQSCFSEAPSFGFSLKWGYIQFITIAWGLHFVFWRTRGIFASTGLVDLTAEYQRRINGLKELNQ